MSQAVRNTSGLKAPWKPGEGGNTAARHRAFQKLLAEARRMAPEALRTIGECVRDPEAPWPARIAAAEVIINRAWGKPKEHVTLEGDGIATLQIRFVDERVDGSTIDGEAFQLSLRHSGEEKSSE